MCVEFIVPMLVSVSTSVLNAHSVKPEPSSARAVTALLTSLVPAERTGRRSRTFSPVLISVSQQCQGHSAEKNPLQDISKLMKKKADEESEI